MTEPEIPKIPELPDSVLKAASVGDLVLFIGSGVSKLVGCPLWEEFARHVLDHLYSREVITFKQKDDLARESDARRLLSICWEILGEEGTRGLDWKAMFPVKESEENIYDLIVGAKSAIITINYDLNVDYAIERYAHSQSASLRLTLPEPKPALSRLWAVNALRLSLFRDEEITKAYLAPLKVIHLHGSVTAPNSMIVTTRDYLKAYSAINGEKTIRRAFLERVFREKTILFIGSHMAEYEILEYLASMQRVRHFMLYPAFNHQQWLVKQYNRYFSRLGIELIAYRRDEQGHKQLGDIIRDWCLRIGAVAAPPPAVDGLEDIDAVEL